MKSTPMWCILAAVCWGWGCDAPSLPIERGPDGVDANPDDGEPSVAAPDGPSPHCPAGGSNDPNQAGTAACNCTRRPGPNRSYQCPIGAGQSTSATIGPDGGKIELLGQQGAASGVAMALIIPPTALKAPVTITITETSDVAPSSLVDLSPVYRLSPSDLQFDLPVAVRMPMGNGSGSYGGVAMYWDKPDGGFERVRDSYTNAGFLQGSTFRLGTALAAVPACLVPPQCRP